MRQRPAPLTSPCPRFNPRPPLLAGDAMDALDRPHEITVSIRARHCWRAMPARGLVAQLRQLKVSIRARHCWRAMRLIANALQTHGFVLVTRERG